MRVLVASTAGAGHLQPLLPFVHALVRRGHETLLVVPPGTEALTAGLPCPVLVGASPAAEELDPLWRQFATATRGEASVIGNREIFGRLCTAAMLPVMEAAAVELEPDLVLREPCDYASAIVANRRGVPHAQVAISTAEGEAASIDIAAPALASFGAPVLASLRSSPYLSAFPAMLDPSPFATTWRYRHVEATPPAALPSWWDGSDAPLVYVTFGSVTGSLVSAAQIYRVALDAVAGLPVRVLMTTGYDVDVATLGSIPSNTRVEPWVAQADVFAEASLVVCHGGSGTTFGAIAAGVPLVVAPMFADQPTNARRVEAAGAAVVVRTRANEGVDEWRDERVGALEPHDAPRLRAAIETVLADRRHRDAAVRIAAVMHAAPTVDDTIDRLTA